MDTTLTQVINLLSELVVFQQYDFGQFLQQLIRLMNNILPADSYLIYFYDAQKKQLMLAGGDEHTITMKEGEGITGWVAQHKETVAISQKAYQDSRFKVFKELPEDTYESFLSVPISNDTGIVGVINIQHKTPHIFSKEEITTIEALCKIIASAFTKIILERKVTKLQTQIEERKVIEKAKGVLMKMRNLSEDQAFSFLRKEAMNKRKSMKEIADAVLLVFPS